MFALCLLSLSSAYLMGNESLVWCWKKNVSTGVQEMMNEGGCPNFVNTLWVNAPPQEMYEDTHYDMSYRVYVPTTMNITRVKETDVWHTNLHACKVVSNAPCVPNVANNPGLVTSTPAVSGDLSTTVENGAYTLLVEHEDLDLTWGTWTIIAHSRWQVAGGTQYDIAIGTRRNILRRASEIPVLDSAKAGVYVFAAIVILINLAALAFGDKHQELSPIKAASWPFCQGIIVSSLLGIVPVFFLADVNDFTCMVRHWLICLTFDGMIGLLVVKTHRVKNIFTRKSLKGGSSDNSNMGILKLWAGAIVLPDLLILAAMTAVDPLKSTKYFTESGDWEMTCDSELMPIFNAILLTFKGVLMAYGLYLATATWNINPKFNESRLIAITVYSVTILCALGLPLSVVVEAQPTELFVLRSAVILMTSLTTIVTIFGPKYHLIMTVDPSEFQKVGEGGATYKSRRSSSAQLRSATSNVSQGAFKGEASLKNGKLSDNFVEAMELCNEASKEVTNRQLGGMVVHARKVLELKGHVDLLKHLMDDLARSMKSNPSAVRSAVSGSVVEMLKEDEKKAEERKQAKEEADSNNL